MQEVLKQMRLTSLGGSEAEYYEFIIKPILDTESLNTSLEIVYEKLSSGEAIDAKNFVTEPIKEALLYAGISIDDFLNSLNDKIDTTV
jgi:hypothetical protein